MLGPMGVDCRSRSRSSRLFLESWDVLNTVLMVQTYHSIKPLDLVKWGEEVTWCMWWHCRNCANSSEVKGEPLSSRAGMVVHIGRWVPASTYTKSGQIWWILCKWRGTCWTDCIPVGTLYPCGWGSQLQSLAMGHQEHLWIALIVPGEMLCASMLGQYTASLTWACIISILWCVLCRSARVQLSNSWGMQTLDPLRSKLDVTDSSFLAP